jgi:hypothetical protein
VFRSTSSGWVQIAKLLAHDGQLGDGFGTVSLSGSTALIGALGDDGACPTISVCMSGSAYVFELAPDARQYGSCTANAPCGNVDAQGGCRNSTGVGANFGAGGSSSVLFDDLVLEASRLPANTNAIVFMGHGQTQLPLGDGLRVVSPGAGVLLRLGLQPADAEGVLLKGPGLAAYSQVFPPLGQIQPGQTWNFQCWYRDPAGPCAHGTNLTNGVAVDFTP